MTWIFLVVGAAGALIGILFRGSTLLAASCVIAIASIATAQLMGFSGQRTFLATLYLVLTLQGTYLVGLFLAALLHRSAANRHLR